MSAENLNKRGNPCGLCGKHHGAGPCPERTRRVAQMIQEPHYDKHVPGAGCPYCEPEQREGEAMWVCPWAWCKRNGGEEWCDKCELRVALAASQEKERQLTEALHRIAHSGGGTFETVDGLRMIALDALDSTQTHGNEECPEGWPDKCANCGADWTQISYDPALGFNCQSCGGSDADE